MHELVASDITFAYASGPPILVDVNARVECGKLLALVGPNGAGKSTLLRVMCGLMRPQGGKVEFDGASLFSLSSLERARHVAFLPQAVNPTFSLSVFEVVCLGRYPHVGALRTMRQEDRDVVLRCLQETRCDALRERDFSELSGGERQRVLIAAILAQEPDILLLDEPTSLLDLHHQIEVFALLKRLTRKGYGVAVVTHDLNTAARFCDHMLLLSSSVHGVKAEGAPSEVLQESTLSEVYETEIRVCPHPITGTPLVTVLDAERSP